MLVALRVIMLFNSRSVLQGDNEVEQHRSHHRSMLRYAPKFSYLARHKKKEGTDTRNEMVWCNTTAGSLHVEVRRDWSPHGADRFVRLIKAGFFKNMVSLFVLL